jgi:hypothetical protein
MPMEEASLYNCKHWCVDLNLQTGATVDAYTDMESSLIWFR